MMSIPNPTKTRVWDLLTPASGPFFNDEFDQIYENTNYLEQSRVSLAATPRGVSNLGGSRPSVTTVTYTADVIVMPNGVTITTYNKTADITLTGEGGLDSSDSETSATWYYVYAISSDDGVTNLDIMLSTSLTAPTLPAGYTQFKRLGAVFNDGSSDLKNFHQENEFYYYSSPTVVLNSNTATSPTPLNLIGSIPEKANKIKLKIESVQASANLATFDIKGYINGIYVSVISATIGGVNGGKNSIFESLITNNRTLQHSTTNATIGMTITLYGFEVDL
jgi:hypothetical protein